MGDSDDIGGKGGRALVGEEGGRASRNVEPLAVRCSGYILDRSFMGAVKALRRCRSGCGGG